MATSQFNLNDDEKWREVEKALRKSQSLAAAGQFAAAIMHEINNPLEAISNLAYLTQREAEDAEKVRGYIRRIEEELANVLRIASQTLGYCRPAGVVQTVDLAAVAESALRVHERNISAKQIRLLKNLGRGAKAKAHAGEMLQVLSNLISNAVDALPPNGTLLLRVRRSGEEVHITIADDGPGIPEQHLGKVFDPFFTTKEEHGTGLGLAISKAIVESHNGRIRTRSSTRHGRNGTAFRISLPIERGARALAS